MAASTIIPFYREIFSFGPNMLGFGEFIVSSKTKTPSGDRGIGLAVCQKIIEAHKGSIVADSDGHS
ncbi:hypothetical protein [Candidatus Phycorickettsia trachydisci]|nr:hypothetical protein [Candidatus Phycorickettsia trachydisci]